MRPSKLTPEDIARIWHLSVTEGHSQVRIAQAMGVSPATISYILNRKTWQHLAAPPDPPWVWRDTWRRRQSF